MAVSFEPLPPKEAIEFFKKKGLKETFAWQDIWEEEHARAFTVAKSTGHNILGDVFTAMKSAQEEGKTFDMFRKELEPTLIKKGWWGRKRMVDPADGQSKVVQLGSRRRLKTIYDTNLRSSRAVGQWERIERNKERRPYLSYRTVKGGHYRPEHRQWHGVTLPIDDPWWNTHYPQNGWGCRCYPVQMSQRDMDRLGIKVSKRPVTKTRPWTNRRTGQTIAVPEGIDPGFAYHPGKEYMRPLTPAPTDVRVSKSGKPLWGKPARHMPPFEARQVGTDRLLPLGLQEEEYFKRFVSEFNLPVEGGFFTDVAGTHIPINELLFRDQRGRWKIKKRDREKFLPLLADTIKDPDEIWEEYYFYESRQGYVLNRKYLTRFEIIEDGHVQDGFVLFELNDDGWYGLTAFAPDSLRYIQNERRGILVYKK
ncbi:PBECR2 nuclease fold domain-containing protein [Emcibacter sp.]|uniref:PBECR2 nuclease fold domain-containing protein n=1 Tax=Emcibacter sp. TaxID=1979954 RepID=UPI002AA72F18|nr:PBECR2 nuclease fold domain-containing protein [Emcibacter sp.]